MTIIVRICEFFTENRNQGAMIKVARKVILWAGNLRSTMEWYRDVDWSALPSSIIVQPVPIVLPILRLVLIEVIVSQPGINCSPFRITHITRVKIWTPNDIQKVAEALTRLLDTAIPVPIP